MVVCATLLIWYYFTQFDVTLVSYGDNPNVRIHVVDTNDLLEFPWIKDMPNIMEKASIYCTPVYHTPSSSLCPYHLPSIHIYQLDSVVDSLQLSKVNAEPVAPILIYSGWVEYGGKYYGLSFNVPQFYENYIFYGFTCSVIGTLVITLIWKKLQNRRGAIRDSTYS